VFAALETKALSASLVDIHGVGVTLSGRPWCWGLVVILRARGVSLKETSTRRHWCARVRMVGGWEIDARRRGGGFLVVGLLVDLRLFLALSAISPLSVELDGLILPDLERGGDRVHRVDAFLYPLDETLFEHLSESDVIVATES